ncbi:MAG: hypothetical protein V4717_17560 [Bacteroidota bacterium]
MEKDKQFNVKHQKFEEEPEYRDVKPADQSGDNDIDRIATHPNDKAKEETDEAYRKNQSGSETSRSSVKK